MELMVGRSGKAEDFFAVATASPLALAFLIWIAATGPVATSNFVLVLN